MKIYYALLIVNSNIPEEKLADAWVGIKELGTRSSNFVHKITGATIRSDNRAVILRIELESAVTQAQVVTKLATKLDYTEQQIINAIDTFTLFEGDNRKDRNANAVAYMCSNSGWYNDPEA